MSTQPLGAGDLLIRRARLVALSTGQSTGEPVDLRIRRGRISALAPHLEDDGAPVLEAAGAWAIPGLWDQHVHLATWAARRLQVDLAGADGPDAVTARVAAHIRTLPAHRRGKLVQGSGYRGAAWSREPTVAELDAVSPDHPVALISGDCHSGWLNSHALRLLGLPRREGLLREAEWFPLIDRIRLLPGASDGADTAYRDVVRDAAARGVVGITDLEFADNVEAWQQRFADGIDLLRVRVGAYPDTLDSVIAGGHRTGLRLPEGHGLLTMGPLKLLTDGSLNTRTAYCLEPYADSSPGAPSYGMLNLDRDQQVELMRTAHAHGLEVAAHAIGDAACEIVIDSFDASGAAGSIEHAQLIRPEDAARMAQLRLTASVQPAHVWDDAAVCERCWPDRTAWCYPLATLLRAGVRLQLGSDAPVAPLDPWLAMAAAVHRAPAGEPPWHQEQALSVAEALGASTAGVSALRPGVRGDIALLDRNPLTTQQDSSTAARELRGVDVRATVVAGRVTHRVD